MLTPTIFSRRRENPGAERWGVPFVPWKSICLALDNDNIDTILSNLCVFEYLLDWQRELRVSDRAWKGPGAVPALRAPSRSLQLCRELASSVLDFFSALKLLIYPVDSVTHFFSAKFTPVFRDLKLQRKYDCHVQLHFGEMRLTPLLQLFSLSQASTYSGSTMEHCLVRFLNGRCPLGAASLKIDLAEV